MRYLGDQEGVCWLRSFRLRMRGSIDGDDGYRRHGGKLVCCLGMVAVDLIILSIAYIMHPIAPPHVLRDAAPRLCPCSTENRVQIEGAVSVRVLECFQSTSMCTSLLLHSRRTCESMK